MFIGFLCVFIASLLPLVLIAYAKSCAGAFKPRHNYDPRKFMDNSEGVAKRAYYAEKNAIEAFPAFAAAVIIATICQVDDLTISIISLLFIFVRVLHGIFYIMDRPTWRSIVWFIGVGCSSTLFLVSLYSFTG